MMTSITIAGPKFSGKPGDWPETKTEIVDAFNSAGAGFVNAMGEQLFKYAGSGDYSVWEEAGLKKHFKEKNWPIQLISLRSEITKRTLDVKSEEYTGLSDDDKKELRDFKVLEWFQAANRACIKALKDHLVPKKDKGGPQAVQLRQIFMTSAVTDIINGDGKVELKTAEEIWKFPAVTIYADLLALFEGKGRSGTSSFWSIMTAAIKSVNPRIKGNQGDSTAYTVARGELQTAWQALKKMYEDEDDPLEALIDRLQAEQHLEMMRLLVSHPAEGHAWEHGYKKCVAMQGPKGGGLTLARTEKCVTEVMNLLAQPARAGAQERQREHAGKDHDALRGFIDRAVDKRVQQKLAGAGPAANKRKQTPGKKPAGGRPGGGARRELEQLRKDACEHCGKKHAGECRYKPGGKAAMKAEARALKAAAELSEMESGEDSGVDGEESDENYSRVSSPSHTARTCTPSQAQLFIAKSARMAYPDTQAEVSVTNCRDDVVRIHPRQAKLQGLLGKPQVAQYADLAFRLRTDTGKPLRLRLRNPGLFLPQAKEILLAHQDLEDAGVRVNYHTGVMRAPHGQTITLQKRGAVWQVPLHTWKTDSLPGPRARRKHRAFIVSSTSTNSATTPSSVERMHQILCCAGTTLMLRYYDHYKGTGFGGASKAEIRAYRCPIKALMQGDANKKMRKPARMHAHVAHLGADDENCPCCQEAELRPKRVRFQTSGPWPAARGEAATPPRRKQGPKPRLPRAGAAASQAFRTPLDPSTAEVRNCRPVTLAGDAARDAAQDSNLRSQGERTTAEAAATTAQGEPAQGERTPAVAAASAAQGEPTQGESTTERDPWMAMPAKYSKKFRKAAGILKHNVKPHEEWHIDWAIMGQETLGLAGEGYTLAVLDVGSNLGAAINTRTREDPWEELRELAALWGHVPKAIRGDGAKEFFHAKGFKAWCAKEKIVFNPVEPYRHTMQGYIENLVKQIKVHSRCILKHANLPARFWSETTKLYMAIRNIMPAAKQSVPFLAAQPHQLHFDPALLLHRPGCLVVVKYPKDHPRVTDTSNGARGACGVFLGCHPSSPLWSRSGCRAQARLDTSKKLRFSMTSCLLSIPPACLTGPASPTPRSRRSASPKSANRPGQARAYKRPTIPHAR